MHLRSIALSGVAFCALLTPLAATAQAPAAAVKPAPVADLIKKVDIAYN